MGCGCGKKFGNNPGGSFLLRTGSVSTAKVVSSAPVPSGLKINPQAVVTRKAV